MKLDRGWIIFLVSLGILTVMIGNGYATGTFEDEPIRLDSARDEIATEVNDMRVEHDLNALDRSAELDRAATAHAKRMAGEERLFHSNGYERAGYGCSGGEVTAYTHLHERVQQEYGEVYVDSGEDLGDALFNQWMHSPYHSDILAAHGTDRIGIGMAKTGNGTVYSAVWVC